MTHLSELDDKLRLAQPKENGRPECWKEFAIDVYIQDGDVIDCGNKSIAVVGTPGHTPGCMSFIFPVYDCGEKHIASLFGGATPPWDNTDGRQQQMKSILHFMKVAKDCRADVALTNHTAFDNGLERIAYSKKRMSFLPNIYILGENGVQKFCDVFRTVAE